jgi:hypothetical protein
MSAVIDGVPWTAGCVAPTETYLRSSLFFAGVDQAPDLGRAQALSILVSLPQEATQPLRLLVPGTYELGGPAYPYSISPYANFNVYCTPGRAVACAFWTVTSNVGAGMVIITSFTSTTAAGTFSLTLLPVNGADGPKIVTNGVFNVTF